MVFEIGGKKQYKKTNQGNKWFLDCFWRNRNRAWPENPSLGFCIDNIHI